MEPADRWRAWGLSYRRAELDWVVSGLICVTCIAALPPVARVGAAIKRSRSASAA